MTLLAVGWAGAEGSHVRRLAGEGRLPTTARLLRDGVWTDVIGSHDHATVWPSFATGRPVSEHGVYSEWVWDPGSMRMVHPRLDRLPMIWEAHPDASIGVFDVPGAMPTNRTVGFEVTGWGQHERWDPDTDARLVGASPPAVAELVAGASPHPLSLGRGVPPASPDDRAALVPLAEAGVEGARQRGDLAARILAAVRPALAVVVFPETHHAQGHLWHDTEPDQAHVADRRAPGRGPGIVQVYEEVDRQIGRLMEANDGEAPIVFSLSGNRPGRGHVDVLPAVLEHHGFARRERGLAAARAQALTAFKRLAPKVVKELWYSRVPADVRQSVAMASLLPPYDWTRTRAFPLSADYNGRVQVNLVGRERDGIVDRSQYAALLDELEALLAGLVDTSGRRLVQAIVRPQGDHPPRLEPDLLIEWAEAASDPDLRLPGIPGVHAPKYPQLTGAHTRRGFCLVPQGVGVPGDDPLKPEDLFEWWLDVAGQRDVQSTA